MNGKWLIQWIGSRVLLFAAFALSFGTIGAVAQQSASDGERWKRSPERWLNETKRPGSRRPTISGYLEEIEKNAPEVVDVVFAGSASIWMWDTKKWFPDYTSINRGFGGSMISDSTYFADRIIIPHKPKVIVMYAGENDVTGGKPLDLMARHFREFVDKIHTSLPHTPIVYVSIRPSNRNWEWVSKFREANMLIKAIADKNEQLHYVDVDTPMIGADGKPRPELYQEDDWHPSEKCYELWTSLVIPVLKASIMGAVR